jgi:hypothetical protein
MSKLERLRAEQGQSPWLDNLARSELDDGALASYHGVLDARRARLRRV